MKYSCSVFSIVFFGVEGIIISSPADENKSWVALLAAAGWAVASSFKTRFINWRNSSSSKTSRMASLFISLTFNASSSRGVGASSIMVASFFERMPCSRKVSTFSFCFPFSLSVFARRPSRLPNSANSFAAVFSPIPGIPGMLSTASPIRPSRSITWLTFWMLNFAQTSASPSISALPPW